jgi:hypothetical protein
VNFIYFSGSLQLIYYKDTLERNKNYIQVLARASGRARGGGGSSGAGRRTYGPLWLLLGSLVGLTFGLGFFPSSFLFRFIYLLHLLCYGVSSSY